MRLKDIGEFGFIDRIRNGCLVRNTSVIKGIGDDCCVFKTSPGLVTLFTTDMLVENIHFIRGAITPDKLGRKSVAVNISDIAAMGGTPREAVVSIAIPDTLEVEYVDAVYDGMKAIAGEFEVNLLGGDTTASPEHLVVNIALVGEALEDEILYRSGARVGDVVFLTGTVGSAAAGLDMILGKRAFKEGGRLLDAHHDPWPHVKAGRIIAGLKVASALIDVSDGVAADLGHICRESGVGATIDEASLPTENLFRSYCAQFDLDPLQLALHVGEDYVLLGTVPEQNVFKLEGALRAAGCEFFAIGTIAAEAGLRLRGADGSLRTIRPGGWDHFR
ncbi:MAG TPA: thiamine-phosphate kinase [Syntrophobacteria bacterium]|nr:thiamine-phosphate kinase [Syntrophobacteria bacterium]